MLTDSLKVILATSYAFVIKTQGFHWNVEGADFPQYHKLFGDIYSEVYENAIDQCAEYIRSLDSYTPASLSRFSELSLVKDQVKIPRGELMVFELLSDNGVILAMLKTALKTAEECDEGGIANFIAERISAHGKWNWQLKSILKKDRA